ncbi:hypothetical protein LPB137_09750 [Poseidonibacter parvus]|uniref:Restriction endonuclease type IV Mrr domain-containing protein n=1 Tax=Poseidonibacter parvus TaxID=1850254 RepID=A0A1P8KNP2_9BACT|nr:hypothetical protein [Poseidonibacter parvus]APW66119.1 hypothetical protein LPB137_09750 [Poseidonibacter parvus]
MDKDISYMIMASLSNIWHIVPIIIAIVLFKKYMNMRNRKNIILKNEEHEKNGFTLQSRAIKKYKDLGYEVTILKDEDKKLGLDLLCIKNKKSIIVQCKNSFELKSIIDEDIKTFCNNAKKYSKENNIEKSDVEFRYIIPYSDVLNKTAIKILSDDYYNCKYVIL